MVLPIEPPRPARSAIELESLIPWARRVKPMPTPLERETSPGVFETRYAIVDGPMKGGTLLMSREARSEGAGWTITSRVEGRDAPLDVRHQSIDPDDGSLVLTLLVNHERGVRVEMTPAPVTVPARLAPGDRLARDVALRLPLIENPRRLREKGTGRSEFTYEGEQEVTTPAGTFAAHLLREVFTSRFSAATAVRTIDRWYAKNRGLIAERWEEEVTVFGVVVERSIRGMVVLPTDGEASGDPPASEGADADRAGRSTVEGGS